jgi:hypothetical protein
MFKFTNQQMLLLVSSILNIISIVVAILVLLVPKKEKFSDTQNKFSEQLLEFLNNSKPDYISYLGFLNDNKNTSVNLVVKKNYEQFIEKSKQQNLTVEYILNIM